MFSSNSFSDITTLIVDDMQTQRTTLRGQLRELDINKVDQVNTAEDAIRLAKLKKYDLVLCDFNLNQKTDGQQLLEYMRDSGVLGPSSLFFMVTAENSYLSVASVSEHRPDVYLLKPISAGDIRDRLRAQLERREAMESINQCLEAKNYAGALAACDALIAKKSRWTMHAMQAKGQTLLQMGRNDEAHALYQSVLDIRQDIVWAQLGAAKALKAAGKVDEASFMAQSIIQSKEGAKNVEAYDLVASCLEALGDTQGALAVLKDSALVIPSARRQRVVGDAAYLNGDLETAKECYARLAKATRGAITSTSQDLLSQAQVMVDAGDHAEAIKLLDAGAAQYRNDPAFTSVGMAVRAQAQALMGEKEAAEASVAKARSNTRRAKADFATVALAKAEILIGNIEAGVRLLETAVGSDHESPRSKLLVGNALRQTGQESQLARVIEGPVAAIKQRVHDATALFQKGQVDEALAAIEQALKEYPENSSVLLHAAQMNCMSLRMKNQLNATVAERVRSYLAKLDFLLPGNERVTKMRLYYRDTLSKLQSPPAAKTL